MPNIYRILSISNSAGLLSKTGRRVFPDISWKQTIKGRCYDSWLIWPGAGADFQFCLNCRNHWTSIVCVPFAYWLLSFDRVSLLLACALVFPLRWHGRWFWQSMVAGVRMHYRHRAPAPTYQKTEEDRSLVFPHLWVSLCLSLFIALLRQEELTLPCFLLKPGNHLSSQINIGSTSVHPLPLYKQRATP